MKNMNYDTQIDTQNDTENDTQNEGKNEGQKLTAHDRRVKILDCMTHRPSITASELSKLLFVSLSTVKRDLKKLSDDSAIEYIGSSKNGYWKVRK